MLIILLTVAHKIADLQMKLLFQCIGCDYALLGIYGVVSAGSMSCQVKLSVCLLGGDQVWDTFLALWQMPHSLFFIGKSRADYITLRNMNTGGQPCG